MPKNKKAKTRHYSSKTSAELSQAEIWDDSALIRSWNDAVAEYEYYHSIHARGEDVEEILRKAEMDELAETGVRLDSKRLDINTKDITKSPAPAPAAGYDAHREDGELEDGELDDEGDLQAAKEALARQLQGGPFEPSDALANTANAKAGPEAQELPNPSSQDQPAPAPPTNNPTIGPSLPPSGVDGPSSPADQTLENIKMAYYWAGYYSGLYDGQRQAQAQGHT